jgi:hypothetical protein
MPCFEAIFDLAGFAHGSADMASVSMCKRLLSWGRVVKWMAQGKMYKGKGDSPRLSLILTGTTYFAFLMCFEILSMLTHMLYSEGDTGTTTNVVLDLAMCFLIPLFFGCCAAHNQGQELLGGKGAKAFVEVANNNLCPHKHSNLSMVIALIMFVLATKLCYSVCSDFTKGTVLFNFMGTLGFFLAGCALPFYFLEIEIMPEQIDEPQAQPEDDPVGRCYGLEKKVYDCFGWKLTKKAKKKKTQKTTWPHGWTIYVLECFDINTLIFGLLSIDPAVQRAFRGWAIAFGFAGFQLESDNQLTDDWHWYYAITTFNIVVFGVLSGGMFGVLLTRAITRDVESTPMLKLKVGNKDDSWLLSKSILYIIVVLDTLTDIPTIGITLFYQTYQKNAAYAVNMVVNTVALMRLFYFTAFDGIMEIYTIEADKMAGAGYQQPLLGA